MMDISRINWDPAGPITQNRGASAWRRRTIRVILLSDVDVEIIQSMYPGCLEHHKKNDMTVFIETQSQQ